MKTILRNWHCRHWETIIIGTFLCMYTASAAAQVSYAKLDTEARTMTFMHDDTRTTLGEGEYALNSGDEKPAWEMKSGAFNKVIFDKSFSKARPTSCHRWFSVCYNLTAIEGIENLCTDEVTNMAYMFYSCSKLASLDVSRFNTSKVTTMDRMFYACTSLAELDVTNFDTSNVTDFTSMFQRCRGLSEINTSKFNTSKATTLTHMFMECDKLQKLDLSNFSLQNVASLSYMFNGCKGLAELDISGWYATGKLTDTSYMFYNCSSLESIDMNSLYTGNVTTMAYMFYGCSSLKSLNISNMHTYGVKHFMGMFQKCSSLESIDLGSVHTDKATSLEKMFSDCKKLTALDLTGFNTPAVSTTKQMFSGCSALQTIYVSSKFDLSACRTSTDMFKGCTALVGGVPFSSTKTDQRMANVADGYFKSYYLTGGEKHEYTGRQPFSIGSLDLTGVDGFVSYMPATVGTATYTRQHDGGKYGTICLPFAISQTEGCKLYRLGGIDYDRLVVKLTPVNRLEAGEAGMYSVDDPAAHSVTFAANGSDVAVGIPYTDESISLDMFVDHGMFYGTYYSNSSVTPGMLLLRDDHMEFSTYYIDGNDVTYDSIGAFMCAVLLHFENFGDIPANITGSEVFSIEVGSTPTAIGGIELDGTSAPAAIYDVSGRKMPRMQKGVNIVKGADGRTRKVVVK